MDTCSERSFRSQRSSASYTGTVNSQRPLLSAAQAHASRDLSQSYYSDDEPQRRSFHRHRFHHRQHQQHTPPTQSPPSPLLPLPPPAAPSQGGGAGRDMTRGYIEMSSQHHFTARPHNRAAANGPSSRHRFDKKKLTSMMANNKAHMANGGVQYTMYKSDSEFTDQSDSSAMQSPPLPPLNQHHPVLSLRHRNVPPSSTNNCSQQHTQKALNNNNNNLHMPNANLMSVNNNNANRLNGGQQLLPQSFPPQHQQLMSANHCSNNNNEVSVQDQNRFRAAKRSSPGMSEMNMANANIHPNLAEHGDTWEKDTVLTGASNKSSSLENLSEFPSRHNGGGCRKLNPNQTNVNMPDESEYGIYMDPYSPTFCQRCFSPVISVVLIALVLISSPCFALLPVLLWSEQLSCTYNCFSTLINIMFKSLILMVGCWAVFFRSSRSTLPSVHLVRLLLLLFSLLFLTCHWIFYLVKVISPRNTDQSFTLQFANSTIDCALFVFYLAVVCLEVMHLNTEYVIKVVRNTDGESRFYTIGHMSIQSCASWILQQYYKDFSVFNPAAILSSSMSSGGGGGGKAARANKHHVTSPQQQYKFYDIDSFMPPTAAASSAVGVSAANALIDKSRAIIAASARKRDAGHNERFYEEQDLERRMKKRRARLIVAAEEAFSHLKRVEDDENGLQMGPKPPMNASESARAIFPSMARALQKYLKITNQQNRYTQEAIYDHLARCLTLDFTPKAFLEKYLKPGPVITSEAEQKPIQSWDLISELGYPNRGIKENVVFQLRQEAISLIVYVARVPHIYIREASFETSNQNTFLLRLDSETSV